MKSFKFLICDIFYSYKREILIENVEDISCAMQELDARTHDDELILNYEEYSCNIIERQF